MLQSGELQGDFLTYLLAFISRPWTKQDRLLQFILEQALALTASDVGGGIFIFDTSGQEPTLVASALRGELVGTSANLLTARKQNPPNPALIVLRSGKSYRIDDYQQDSIYFLPLAGSRSSLWVPVFERKRGLGVIHVASSQPDYYREAHLYQLQSLATEIVPAINWFLLIQQMAKVGAPTDIVGVSTAFLKMEQQFRLVAAQSQSPVLITGERGSGKELTAWAIHCWSNRRDKSFVPVLASAFAESLFADELFGHERYAFTGAARERQGKFKAAEGGTMFLDEVGDLTLAVQSALLRIIERGELPRIGRDLPLRADVRVVAATNQNLRQLIAQGQFREDLYDRLGVFEIRVPPMRERQEDIPLLTSHFLRKYCHEIRRDSMGADICSACQHSERVGCASAEFYQAFQTYPWPGNVRELENLILRLLTFVPDEVLDVKHLPEHFPGLTNAAKPEVEDLTLDAAIRNHIERVLQMTGYNQSQATRILGVPLSTLRSKMKKLGIEMKGEQKTVSYRLTIL